MVTAMNLIYLILLYLLVLNLLAFCLMGIDKRRARNHRWRISERTLLLCALLGGSFGAMAAMVLFRHKTRHWYFAWGIPAMLLAHLILLFNLLLR